METTEKTTSSNNNGVMSIEIYNANRETVFVSPLSDDHQPHCGRIVINDESVENIRLIRFMFSSIELFDFATRPFLLAGRKVNLSYFISQYQNQDCVMDVPFRIGVNELDFKIPLNHSEYCNVYLFGNNERAAKVTVVTDPFSPPNYFKNIFPEKEAYLLISNDSYREYYDINLIDFMKQSENQIANKEKYPNVTVHNVNFNVGDSAEFNLLRVWTKTFGVQHQSVISYDGIPISPPDYMSPMANRAITDIPEKFTITPDTKLITRLHPQQKIYYSFY